MRRAFAGLVLLCACYTKPDEPGHPGDAGATATCKQWGGWGAEVELVTLNSDAGEYFPALSGDNHRIIFQRADATTQDGNIWEASWDDNAGTFGAPFPHFELDAFFGEAAQLSADGLTLWPTEYCPSADLFEVTRPSLDKPFEPQNRTELVGLNTQDNDEVAVSFSADLREAAFMRGPVEAMFRDVFMATRASPADPWSTPMPIASIAQPDYYDCCPSLSADGLSLLWTADFPAYATWLTTRPSRSEPFGTAERFLPTSGGIYDNTEAQLSWDGSTLSTCRGGRTTPMPTCS